MVKKYKKAKIYRGPTGDPEEKWFVYYRFKHPDTGRFERFKVYEGINYIHKLEDKNEFADELLKQINSELVAGYDPYKVDQLTEELIVNTEIVIESENKDKEDNPLLTEAFIAFLNTKREKDLEPETIATYESFIGKFENYLIDHKAADIRIKQMDAAFLKDMLKSLHLKHEWNGTTYNNHLAFWVTLLNWFAKKPRYWVKRDDFEIGTDGELEPKVSKPMKHQYFGDTVAEKVKEKLSQLPKLNFYSKFIYFSCMRPDEIRDLQIQNVDISGRYIKIIGKTKSRTIPICDELAEMLTSLKLEQYPLNYYVLGKEGYPASIQHSENYYSRIFREQVRKPLGINHTFSSYGWKHTRVVDLLNKGYHDAEVMNLTGHKDTASYDLYKRELINYMDTRLRGKTIGW